MSTTEPLNTLNETTLLQDHTRVATGSASTLGGESTLDRLVREDATNPQATTPSDTQIKIAPGPGAAGPTLGVATSGDTAGADSAATPHTDTREIPDTKDGYLSISQLPFNPDTELEQSLEGPTRPEMPPIIQDSAKKVVHDNLARFGDRDNYWTNYEELTKKYDEDTMGRLNSNLENVLIFVSDDYIGLLARISKLISDLQAGLFSAVNSAFIILAMSNFITNPAEDTNTILAETNALLRLLVPNSDTVTPPDVARGPQAVPSFKAVRQLCVFFASLALSLAAAFGAVLAKQWLQFYEHTGELERSEKKGRSRTERYYGAESWGLRIVVEALPTLLLISLALFFGALADYLWTINKPAAITITAFAAALGLFYCITVVAAAIFPHCPFQTAPSVGLRHLYQRTSRLLGKNTSLINSASRSKPRWRSAISEVKKKGWISGARASVRAMRILLRRIRGAPRRIRTSVRKFWASCKWILIDFIYFPDYYLHLPPLPLSVIPLTIWMWIREGYRRAGQPDKDITHAQSALWIMETAHDHEHLLVVAKNVTSLDKWDAVRILRESQEFPKLLYGFHASLIALQQAHERKVKAKTVEPLLDTVLSFARAVAHIILTDPDLNC
ncbi:hypothetical protein FRB95_006195 [Tulasnella sp. JGI-2019a]|nr:hypothetical protein FRB93_008053 [Tulasnella sp. JGI-2019a]KAG9037252.1 hypothetical protein FRB95_006195 [Tulasnella sp. JGI-2019a]